MHAFWVVSTWWRPLHLTLLVLVLGSFTLGALVPGFHPRLASRIRRKFETWGTYLLLFLGFVVLLCGIVGFGLKERDTVKGVLATAYQTCQMFFMNVEADKLKLEPDAQPADSPKKEAGEPTSEASIPKEIDPDLLDAELLLTVAMLLSSLFILAVALRGISALFREANVSFQLSRYRHHVVICGLGRIGREILINLIEGEKQRQIVVIEPDAENDHVDWVRQNGALVVIGDATRKETLDAARVCLASEVFLVTGRDETNIEAAIELRDVFRKFDHTRWLRRKPVKLRCHVHILNRDLAAIVRIQSEDVEAKPQADLEPDTLQIEVFNALDRTARRLIETMVSLEVGAGSERKLLRPTTTDEVSHFVILGFGEFGQTLALQLAEHAHFENLKRLRMTILDFGIQETAKPFLARYPRFAPATFGLDPWSFEPESDLWSSKLLRPAPSACTDEPDAVEYVCNAKFQEMFAEITDDEFIGNLCRAFHQPGVRPAILVCFNEDGKNFALAERLREKLRIEGILDWPIFVWIPEQRELAQLLTDQGVQAREKANAAASEGSDPRKGATGPLIPFGECSGSTSYAEITKSWSEWLARSIHVAWSEKFAAKLTRSEPWTRLLEIFEQASEPGRPLPEFDFTEVIRLTEGLWAKEPEAMRASNRSAAIHSVVSFAILGRKVAGFQHAFRRTAADVPLSTVQDEMMRQMAHNRWVAERLLAGWRYSSKKNADRKLHHMIVPWHAVPPDEREKDETLVQLVVGMARTGMLKVESLQEASNA